MESIGISDAGDSVNQALQAKQREEKEIADKLRRLARKGGTTEVYGLPVTGELRPDLSGFTHFSMDDARRRLPLDADYVHQGRNGPSRQPGELQRQYLAVQRIVEANPHIRKLSSILHMLNPLSAHARRASANEPGRLTVQVTFSDFLTFETEPPDPTATAPATTPHRLGRARARKN